MRSCIWVSAPQTDEEEKEAFTLDERAEIKLLLIEKGRRQLNKAIGLWFLNMQAKWRLIRLCKYLCLCELPITVYTHCTLSWEGKPLPLSHHYNMEDNSWEPPCDWSTYLAIQLPAFPQEVLTTKGNTILLNHSQVFQITHLAFEALFHHCFLRIRQCYHSPFLFSHLSFIYCFRRHGLTMQFKLAENWGAQRTLSNPPTLTF